MQKTLKLKSPGNEQYALAVPPESSRLDKPFNGSICAADGSEFDIADNIISVIGTAPDDMSMAQSTNHWSLTAEAYENLWRKRSIGILSGDEYSLADEAELLNDWMKPREGEWFLDVGCSTGFYARSLVEREPGCSVVALDFSLPMLAKAREQGAARGAGMYLVRADARQMPFYTGTFDGIVSGGTLNELTDPQRVLHECRRVITKKGRFFIMHLLRADTWYGKLLQQGSGIGGIHFWTADESDEIFTRAGFRTSKRETKGIVCFTLLEPAE
jgi:ubiquinone/menaquinone biosynthesis C-methylase UbiE